jgi:hypothetical protein
MPTSLKLTNFSVDPLKRENFMKINKVLDLSKMPNFVKINNFGVYSKRLASLKFIVDWNKLIFN